MCLCFTITSKDGNVYLVDTIDILQAKLILLNIWQKNWLAAALNQWFNIQWSDSTAAAQLYYFVIYIRIFYFIIMPKGQYFMENKWSAYNRLRIMDVGEMRDQLKPIVVVSKLKWLLYFRFCFYLEKKNWRSSKQKIK